MEKDKVTLEDLVETVTMMSAAIETQNAVILCLLHKFDTDSDLPTWQDKDSIEKEMEPKINACVKAIRKTYGHGETDKS